MAIRKDRLLIEKKNIPYKFSVALPRTKYDIEIRYNETADLFTVSLYKSGNLICIEPIIYGVPLFSCLYKPDTFPKLKIIPQGNGEEKRVTWDNFNETVFLEIDNTAGE